MRAPAEDAVGSLNCIGFCDSKIFQKRGRIYRPIKLYEPPIRQEEGIQPGRTRCASIRPYRLHIPSEERIEPVIPVAKPKNVKRMHTRRDRIRKYILSRRSYITYKFWSHFFLSSCRANSVEQQSADEFHDDTPVNEKEDDSPPPPAQILSRILFAICGILTVSLGLVVVIYTFIILFCRCWYWFFEFEFTSQWFRL